VGKARGVFKLTEGTLSKMGERRVTILLISTVQTFRVRLFHIRSRNIEISGRKLSFQANLPCAYLFRCMPRAY